MDTDALTFAILFLAAWNFMLHRRSIRAKNAIEEILDEMAVDERIKEDEERRI